MRTNNSILSNTIGKVFDNNVTVAEALEQSGANFTVKNVGISAINPEIQALIDNNQDVPASLLKSMLINNRVATMREDNNQVLGVVSNGYEIVQNKDAFDFVDLLTNGQISEDNAPSVVSAGVLHGGKRVFISTKFPEPISIDDKGNDIIDSYLVMSTTHDGTGAVRVVVTPIRVWCQNTLNIAFRENTGKLSFKHTANIHNKMDLTNSESASFAFKCLNLYNEYKKVFEAKIRKFKNLKLDEKWVDDILAQVILPENSYDVYRLSSAKINAPEISTRARNQFDEIKACLYTGIGQEVLEPNTGLWLINGITTYYQNEQVWKDEEKKFDSIIESNGYVQKRLQNAYELVDSVA